MAPEQLANPPARRRRSRLTACDRGMLTVVALLVLIPGIARVSLTDRDEGWYAQVSREMVTSGDWLLPTYLGAPWIAKPPLLYWCVSASYLLFGLQVWAARLVSVLALLTVVHFIGSLAGEMYNRRAALFAAISFVTAGLPAIVGKMLLTDGVLLLTCVAAMYVLWRQTTRRPTLVGGALFWSLVGLGILAKGPAVLVFVGSFGLGLLFWRAARRHLFAWRLWIWTPLAVLIAAPWYLLVAQRAGDTLVEQFLWYEIFSRITGTPHGHGGPPGYYILLSLAGWLPWTALVPGAVLELIQARRRDPLAGVLLIWCFVPWIILELITSKLPHYILPCYVPLAIMLGRMWDAGLDRSVDRAQRVVLLIWAVVPVLLGAGLVALALAGWHYAWAPGALAGGGVLALGFLLAGRQAWRQRLSRSFVAATVTTVLFHCLLGWLLLPGFEPYRLSRNVAAAVNRLAQPGDAIAVVGYQEPSTFFYIDQPARTAPGKQLPEVLETLKPPYVLAVREQDARAAGLVSAVEPAPGWPALPQEWLRVDGFNYVNGSAVTVLVGRRAADSD